MKIQGVFETALLKHIQDEVDQLAEGIKDYEVTHNCCYGHSEDDSCCCDTGVYIQVEYRVPRELARYGFKVWTYHGNFFELINMLDRAE